MITYNCDKCEREMNVKEYHGGPPSRYGLCKKCGELRRKLYDKFNKKFMESK